jgi:hypothetical protein
MIKLLHFLFFKCFSYTSPMFPGAAPLVLAPANRAISNNFHFTNKLKSNKLIN